MYCRCRLKTFVDAIHVTESRYRSLWPDDTTRKIWLYYRVKRLCNDPFFKWLRAGLTGKGQILEIGAGTGELGAALSLAGEKVLITDINPSRCGGIASLEGVSNGWLPMLCHFAVEDFTRLGHVDETFDAVVARDALHHAIDLPGCLFELNRVTKRGGCLFAREPVRGSLIPTRMALGEMAGDPTHEHVYTIRKWVKSLKAAGFADIQVTPQPGFHPLFGRWRQDRGSRGRFSYVPAYLFCRKP
jgi:ubiquinone/menaquinone biosynthesis C-methylase UbiE